jgi:predicted phosphodiesterase
MSDTGTDTDKANNVLVSKLLEHIDLMLHLGDIQFCEVLDTEFSNRDILLLISVTGEGK